MFVSAMSRPIARKVLQSRSIAETEQPISQVRFGQITESVMQWIQRLSIRNKMLAAFMSIMLMADLGGGIALFNLARVNDGTRALAVGAMPRLREAAALRSAVHDLRIAQYQAMLADEDADRKGAEADVAKAIAAAQSPVQRLSTGGDAAGARATVERIRSHWDAYLQGNEKAMKLSGEFGLKAMGGDYRKQFDGLMADLDELAALEGRAADSQVAAAESTFFATQASVLGVLLAANVLGLIVAFVVSARIAVPLAAAARSARAVAHGDLTQQLPATSQDEVGRLTAALNDMQTGLRDLVIQVRNGVHSMGNASSEIAGGSMHLSNRTEQQANDLMETAHAISVLSENVGGNAASARRAAEVAHDASTVARRGGEVTSRVIETMGRISQSSVRIAEIVGVIDGIAFQTNILALNAAVEAARAGEQGRGFAVVASEVRSLAQRSAQSAREIKSLISQSVEVVQQGTALVHDAGSTMQDMMLRADEVTTLIQGIFSATEVQSTDIARLDRSIARINDVTHQNSALVEESAAAAASLQQQGRQLGEAIAAFKT
jgi:methyl-accepting chemotaxis protein